MPLKNSNTLQPISAVGISLTVTGIAESDEDSYFLRFVSGSSEVSWDLEPFVD